MERVSVIEGEEPLLIVAPHGFNDDNTAIIAETIAQNLQCYAVINNCWERSAKVDWARDKADCNDVNHCQEDVVKEEFFEPYVKYAKTIQQESGQCDILLIHGMGNHVREKTKDTIDGILGFGANKSPSYSCDIWRKNGFLYLAQRNKMKVYQGAVGGSYSGYAKKNLNQYWRKWEYDDDIHSMQLELVYDLRKDKDIIELTCDTLTDMLAEYLDFINTFSETDEAPPNWHPNWEQIAEATPSF